MSATPSVKMELHQEIKRLAKTKNAVILAHNYTLPEVQEVADVVGDSLQLAQAAAKTDAAIIVLCGVHFMAETAALLNPDKKVLIPDLEAGCSLADTINAEQLRAWKAEHPGAVVVSYVNTTAEVKAESDICCTSSNAVAVVQSIPPDKEILFCPDLFLGSYVKKVTGRQNMHIWLGECHVHAGIKPETIAAARQARPGSDFLIHPECGCITHCLDFLAHGQVDAANTHVLSTSGMLRHARQAPGPDFVVATEVGMLYPLQKENPEKRFYPVDPEASCRYMKMMSLEKIHKSLTDEIFAVTVPPQTAAKARLAVQRMLEIA